MNEPIIEIDKYGTKRYRLNGKLHCEDGPAIEYSDGSKAWYINGKRHRLDGPANKWGGGVDGIIQPKNGASTVRK